MPGRSGHPRTPVEVPTDNEAVAEKIRLFLKATSTNTDFDPRFAVILAVLAQEKVALTWRFKQRLAPVHPRVVNAHLEQLRRLGWIDYEIARHIPGRHPHQIWRLAVPFTDLMRLIATDSDRREKEAKEAREALLQMADAITREQFTQPALTESVPPSPLQMPKPGEARS